MNPEISPKATSFPAKLSTAALVLTALMLAALVWLTFESYQSSTKGQLRNLRIVELRGIIVHLDEVLTMSARMAATTGDTAWERRYRQFEQPLDAAIKEAMLLSAHSETADAAAQTDVANFKLVEMENSSFAFVRAGKASEARAILFSDAYETQKKIYAAGMATLVQHLNEQLAFNQREKKRETIFFIVAVIILMVMLFLAWLSIVARLKSVHKELLEASRLAGKAEAATAILHNVGNVLNSVNIASSCVSDSLRKSKAANLAKIVKLLREHESDLGSFLTRDEKGKQIVGYLDQLAEHLVVEQNAALKELAYLQTDIDHIKEIVCMQQGFAKSSGMVETINIADLVEDALRMNSSGQNRQNTQIVREFTNLSPVKVDKHKVLQILVNLIGNAKYACEASGLKDTKITVRTTSQKGRVQISIRDNGIGITPENLIRIFSRGFTTKKDGHGFGLHSCFLAANEMAGSLSVASEGLGQGAIFTLELPDTIQRKQDLI